MLQMLFEHISTGCATVLWRRHQHLAKPPVCSAPNSGSLSMVAWIASSAASSWRGTFSSHRDASAWTALGPASSSVPCIAVFVPGPAGWGLSACYRSRDWNLRTPAPTFRLKKENRQRTLYTLLLRLSCSHAENDLTDTRSLKRPTSGDQRVFTLRLLQNGNISKL